MNIRLINYRNPYSKDESVNSLIKENINTSITAMLGSIEVKEINVYNLEGKVENYDAGSKDRMVILYHATPQTKYENDIDILNDETGEILAIYRSEYNDLYIPNNHFETFNDASINAFKGVMTAFYNTIWLPKLSENSWVHTNNRDALLNRFKKVIEEAKRQQIRSDRENIDRWNDEIAQQRRYMKQTFDKIQQKMLNVVAQEESLGAIGTGIIKDLDLIAKHPKIKDVVIKDNKLTIHTNTLEIHADNGGTYQGCNYSVEIELQNANIKFFGTEGYRGYWTENDPHPHVNGRNGEACLGNVSATIAELCSQLQIYALALVCIDFLEAANTSDPAGRKVVNWPLINGDAIEEEEEQFEYECDDCGCGINDATTVYSTIDFHTGRPRVEDDRYVCERCLDNYFYLEEMDDYLLTSVYNDNADQYHDYYRPEQEEVV